MNITWHGQTCFRINSQKNKNGTVSILINPFDEGPGFRPPKLDADVLLLSNIPEQASKGKKLSSIDKNNFLISGPGEYDIKGIYFQGIRAKSKTGKQETVIYTIKGEEIKICHLGRLGQEELSSEQIEKIGEIDILMIPIGGGDALNVKEAIKIMVQIEPKIIIPMYYQAPEANLPNDKKSSSLNEFLKNLGIKSLEPLAKLSIKKKDISSEESKIIVLAN